MEKLGGRGKVEVMCQDVCVCKKMYTVPAFIGVQGGEPGTVYPSLAFKI